MWIVGVQSISLSRLVQMTCQIGSICRCDRHMLWNLVKKGRKEGVRKEVNQIIWRYWKSRLSRYSQESCYWLTENRVVPRDYKQFRAKWSKICIWTAELEHPLYGDFSVALRGRLRFVFNFELGQWNFACHQPYTKSNCKNIFQVIISTPSTCTTPSNSSSRCTTSRLSLIKNEHLKHVSWTFFEKKMIWMGPKVIWGL